MHFHLVPGLLSVLSALTALHGKRALIENWKGNEKGNGESRTGRGSMSVREKGKGRESGSASVVTGSWRGRNNAKENARRGKRKGRENVLSVTGAGTAEAGAGREMEKGTGGEKGEEMRDVKTIL